MPRKDDASACSAKPLGPEPLVSKGLQLQLHFWDRNQWLEGPRGAMIWSLKNFMNKRSAEWMVAVTAYLPTGIFWWVICSLPFVMFAAFRFSPSSPPPFLVYTPDSARSQLVKLAAYTLFLGILGSLAIVVSLEI